MAENGRRNYLEGKVLITGGAGYLGRAIIGRAQREGWDADFTVYSRDETKQWELRNRYPHVRCVLGDVARDQGRLRAVMAGQDLVIHAAAVKYIPEAEWNVWETIDVNVIGSRNVAAAAIASGVDQVVGISTDKACAPVNVYGQTKALMERIFAEADRMAGGRTHFSTVRYGNVVGSTGSVVPVFRKQLERDGYVSLTDPAMTRFWLSPDEAVDLVCWAAQESGGTTCIGRCPALSLADLAEACWQDACKGRDLGPLPKVIIGARPGEKKHESLFSQQEAHRIELVDGRGFALYPPVGELPEDLPILAFSEYRSDSPDRWLSVEEFRAIMREAALI